MSAAFRFPGRTGVAQHDGLALLRHVVAHGVTPVDIDACKLALHAAPLAYQGAPEAHTVAAVNGAVDVLAAAVRRLSAAAADEAREKAARLAKLAQLFDGEDDRPNAGPMAPLAPVTPLPPAPDAIHAKLDDMARGLATKAGIGFEEARDMLIARIRSQRAATPEAA